MNFTSVAIGIFGGSVITIIAKKLTDLWNRNKAGIQEELVKDVKAVDTYFEDRWGLDLLDDESTAVDNLVSRAVAFVDKYAASKDFWKLVLNNVMTLNPAKFKNYVEQLKSINWGDALKNQVEAELLKIINDTKKEVAVKLVENKAIVANLPPIEDLPAKINAATVANKINEPIKPITKELMEQLAAESEKRQEALRASLQK